MKRYIKRSTSLVTGIQLNLPTSGFSYEKWGGMQTCKHGDWIIDNGGDIYTIDGEVFANTYRSTEVPNRFLKSNVVYAKRAESNGSVKTNEGVTHYRKGDYLVFNDKAQTDGYAVSESKFESMYEEIG